MPMETGIRGQEFGRALVDTGWVDTGWVTLQGITGGT